MVRGMRGVGGVCDMHMGLAQGDVGDEWISGLSLGFTNPVGTCVLDMCLCLGCSAGGEWLRGLNQGLEGWVVFCVCASSESGLCI